MKILLTVYSKNVNNTLSLSTVFQSGESIRHVLLISTGDRHLEGGKSLRLKLMCVGHKIPGEFSGIGVNLVLLALALFVVFGRFVIVPNKLSV